MLANIFRREFSMRNSIDKQRFTELIKALEGGWEIEEPVMLGAMWKQALNGKGAYHFVLRNKVEGKTTLVSLPPSPQLLVFLSENKINVSAVTG